ncbi:hypothetical protein BJ165DRAFT_195275 [Panaeolus papilionaceus]|nr:hypothetical protein BJ165DRAFT_195275 [Panaeolus papilionaceus]
MTDVIPMQIWRSIQVRNYVSTAAMTCLIWEWVCTFQDEVVFIWRNPTAIKRLYLLIRYAGLIGQIGNHIANIELLPRLPLSHNVCRIWFATQCGGLQTLTTLLDLVLMLRIYALYHRVRWVPYFLITLFCLEFTVTLYTGVKVNLALRYDEACIVVTTPKEILGMSICSVVVQLIIWIMTWYKRVIASRERTPPAPIMHVIHRDGLIVCIGVTFFFGVTVPYSYFVHDLTHSVFSCLITLLSVAGCRIIMNMQQIKVPPDVNTADLDIELTSCIQTSIGDPWREWEDDHVSPPTEHTAYVMRSRRSVSQIRTGSRDAQDLRRDYVAHERTVASRLGPRLHGTVL